MRSRLAIEPGGVWVRVPIKAVGLSESMRLPNKSASRGSRASIVSLVPVTDVASRTPLTGLSVSVI